jgi:hypothetical protein
MQHFLKHARPAVTALMLALSTGAALADSTSSAASSTSASLGSSSTSLGKSSDGSSSSRDKVAQGPYRIVEMVALADPPNRVQLRLVPTALPPGQATAQAAGADIVLTLPRETAERARLAAGQVITAEHRPYGLAFATLDAAGRAEPFFLVLDDAWYRELASRPVGA